MKTIEIAINNKIASVAEAGTFLVGWNDDYQIHFTFDDPAWTETEIKTARFIFGTQIVDKIFTGDTCPGVRVEAAYGVAIGVYAGNISTSTPAFIDVKKSIVDDEGLPLPPEPDVYLQLLQLMSTVTNAQATVDDQTGTPEVEVSFVTDGEMHLQFEFHNLKGTGAPGHDGESIVSFNTTDAIDTYIASYAFPHFFFVWGGPEATEYEFTKADGTSGRKSLSIGDVFGVTINTEVHKIVSFDGTKGNIRGAKGNTGNTGATGADGADGKPGSPVPFTDTSAAKTYLANNLGSSQTILILNASEANMLFLTYTVAPNEIWAVANDADHTGWRNATFTKRGSIIGTNGTNGKNAYPMTSVSSTSDITEIQTALSSGTYASSDAYAWVSVAFSTYVKGDLLHVTTSAVTVTYHYDTYDIGIDDEPTEDSQNLVRSGGVWAMIQSSITDAIGGSY